MHSIRLFVLLFAVTLLGAGAGAQGETPELRIPIPDLYELPVTVDDNGLQQWGEYHQNCPNCKGTKKTVCFHCHRLERNTQCLECKMKKETVCRVCAGEGELPDPLEKVMCATCMGAGIFPCELCGWEGNYKIVGGGGHPTDCAACKGAGAHPCMVCRGAKLVDPPRLRPSVGEADLKDLNAARDAVTAVFEAVDKWEPTGTNTRKEIKEYQKMLLPAVRYLPTLRLVQRDFEAYMKRMLMGANFEAHEQNDAQAMNRYRLHNLHYLRHQKRLLDLCILRQEHNQKVLGDK